ncbi:MAG: replication initiator protein A [Clostridia bacterium]|nr:replication initiator protein A [Clostridia bacterium]
MLSTLYYYGGISKMDFDFCKAPKIIFKSEKLKKLSPYAKLLYIALMDRLSLSIKNDWVDESNRYYVYYTVRDAMNDLDCCVEKAIKTFRELDVKTGIGLIERKRRGFGKAAVIYIYNPSIIISNIENHAFISSDTDEQHIKEDTVKADSVKEDCVKEDCVKENCIKELCCTELCDVDNDSYASKNDVVLSGKVQEFSDTEPNNNNINKNKLNNININNNQSFIQKECEIESVEKRNFYKKILVDNISYEQLKMKIPQSRLDEILNVIISALCTRKKYFKINGDYISYEVVKDRLLKLEDEHIKYVYNSLNSVTEQIKNFNSYIITALYRSYESLGLWIDNKNNLCS